MRSFLGLVGAVILLMATMSAAEEKAKVHYIANEGFLVEIGGVALLHVGDAVLSQNPEVFSDGVFENVKLDIVFLEYFDCSKETKAILDDRMNVEHLVFMHLPPQAGEIETISHRLELTFPNRVIFDTPLQAREF